MSEPTNNTVASGWPPFVAPNSRGRMPWKSSRVWFWGLLSLLIAVLASIAWGVPHIESRLDRLSRARLLSAGIDASTLNLRWDYRNLTINGQLPPNADIDRLTEVLRQEQDMQTAFFATGIRHMRFDVQPAVVLENDLLLIEEVTDLSVNVRVEHNSAELDGMVQTQRQREMLVGALLESGVENISDNLDVLSDNASTGGGDTKVGVLAAMLVNSGPDNVETLVADLNEGNLNYLVTAKTSNAAKEIENEASVAMVDFHVNGQMSTMPDGAVEVIAKTDGKVITLSGQVLSLEQHRRLQFAADEAMGGTGLVIDQLQITEQQAGVVGTDDRIDGLASVLASFKQGVTGQIQMRGKQISLDAAVDSETSKTRLLEVTASARGRGLRIQETITVAHNEQQGVDEVVQLQQRLDAIAEDIQANVIFGSGASTLSSNAHSVLSQVTDMINAYPDLLVEVEGHTDNVGRDSINEALSQKRANAVKSFLVSQSVAKDRLVAVGYGHRKPLVSNDTVEGRKRNRRVHFNVVESNIFSNSTN